MSEDCKNSLGKLIDGLLEEGYRNLYFIPTGEHQEDFQVEGCHRSKSPQYVGEKYRIGSIRKGEFYHDIPF